MNSVVISKHDGHYLVTVGVSIIRIFDKYEDAVAAIKEMVEMPETKEHWPNEPPDFVKEIMDSKEFKEG